MEIGSKLKYARNECGFTQEKSAEMLGVSRQTISNWENDKSYPDIISVIKMSDMYSVSLDHLLKEDNAMEQTYQKFLEECTNVVKGKRRLEKVILFSTYFIVWIVSIIIFWNINSYANSFFDVVLRWVMMPLLLLLTTIVIGKNDYWGNANWFSLFFAGISFLTIPYTRFEEMNGEASYIFIFPNIGYMIIGILIAACGVAIGTLMRKRLHGSKSSGIVEKQ